MTKRPYCLTMDDKLVDFYPSLDKALESARTINTNRTRSSEGKKKKQHIKIIYDTHHETKIVHEE